MSGMTLLGVRFYFESDHLVIDNLSAADSVRIDESSLSSLLEFLHNKTVQPNRRNAIRIPIAADSGLEVKIIHGDKEWPAVPVDLSMTGIMVQIDDTGALAVDSKVLVELTRENETILLAGIVRHLTDGHYGIFFPETIVDDEVQPPKILRMLVSELQRQWLRKRLEA